MIAEAEEYTVKAGPAPTIPLYHAYTPRKAYNPNSIRRVMDWVMDWWLVGMDWVEEGAAGYIFKTLLVYSSIL